jgi:hypothetical protein
VTEGPSWLRRRNLGRCCRKFELAARGSDNNNTVFVGETVAVLGLGFSWFLQGSELFNLLREEPGLPPMLRPADLNEPTVPRRAPAVDAKES